MRAINQEQFNELIKKANCKPWLKRELRFVSSTASMIAEDWRELELVSITDHTGRKGILLLEPDDKLFILPYTLSRGLLNRQTGRLSPIICDFCRTWQAGNNAASISFKKDPRSFNSVSFLCCADLACSKHVRGKTSASVNSRTQLREDLTNERRVERLKSKLRECINNMDLKPIT